MLEPHLLTWVQGHAATLLDPDRVETFGAVLAALPWKGTHLDWSSLNGLELPYERVADHGREARLYRHDLACAWLGPGRHGVVAAVDDVMADLDLLFWKLPGHHYLCGAERTPQGDLVVVFDDLGEYDGGDWVRLRL